MGVGDYVHSKEAIQLRPSARGPSHRSRQQLTGQGRVDVPPAMPLNRPPQRDNYGAASLEDAPHTPAETIQHRDMFDTDVEGVDDSTIAATSVLGIDELRPQLSPATTAQRQGIDLQPLYQYHAGAHSFDPQWYDNLGDKAMKSAGFSSDDGGDNASQLTSMAGDDERSEATNESDHFHRRHRAEEPLSRRLQSFWNASRKTPAQPDHHQEEHPEPAKTPAFDRSTSDPRITSHIPISTNRKPALPHTMSSTPRTRFSPPKPSLLDKLGDRTPTRRSSGPRPQPSRQQPSMPAPDPDREEPNLGSFSMDFGLNRGSNNPSLTAFDMTNLDGLDNSYEDYDPFSRRGSVRRIGGSDHNGEQNNSNNNNPSLSSSSRAQKKRLFEADYPPEELHQKTFDSLQAEPFDHNPAAARASATLHPTQEDEAHPISPEDKIAFLSRLSSSDRDAYFSNLTMEEWEDCGDVLVEQFGSLLKKMKELRHARRKTAAVFEAEVKRRHETVEEQSAELSRKLDEMRSGGAEVLRGRTP